jgi:osmotically-inducible protein OsmY
VTDGVATLEGYVDNLREKHRAVEICMNIKGVRSVVDLISLTPQKVSDAQLQNDLGQVLYKAPTSDTSEVQILVKNGEVTLSGAVESPAEKQFVELEVYGTRGVRDVHNNQDIETDKLPRPEPDIKNDVTRRLETDLLVDNSAIQVRVDGAEVKLSGKVSSAEERARATYDAWLTGVAKVDDRRLVVEPWEYDLFRRPGDDLEPGTDSEIENAMKTAFLYDPRVLSPELHVSVIDGLATLTGTVDTQAAKVAATEDARNTVGVLLLHNHLVVKPG